MRRKGAWFGGLALAVVIGAGVTIAYVVDYTDGERPGAAFPDIGSFDGSRTAAVKLPPGTLEVKLGSPSQDFDTDFDETTRAADGAVFVPVGWQLTGSQLGIANDVPAYQFQLTLVAAGRRYDLQAGHEEEPGRATTPVVPEGSVAAVVEGNGEDLSLEVEYDGLTQVLDVDSGKIDSGLAAPFYAKGGLTRLSSGDCSALSPADAKKFFVSLDECSLGPVTLTPYVGGLGWVSSGTESWATVPYSLQVGGIDAARGGEARYSTSLRRFDVTLDGAKARADLLRYRNGTSVLIAGVKVFRTTTAPKSLNLTTELVGDSRFNGAGTRAFRNAQTFSLR